MIQVTKVKKKFNNSGLQISAQAINLIRADFNRQIDRMIYKCKNNNVKRLTDKTYHISIGVWHELVNGSK